MEHESYYCLKELREQNKSCKPEETHGRCESSREWFKAERGSSSLDNEQ